MTVATLVASASASSGTFSTDAGAAGLSLPHRCRRQPSGRPATRRSGQTSSSSSDERQRHDHRLRHQRQRDRQRPRSQIARAVRPLDVARRRPTSSASERSVLSTSLRSAIHATDSTCSGCTANIAATNALGPCSRVIRRNIANSSSVFATWITRFVTWCAPGVHPVKRDVEHVRQPRQRMPVRRMPRRQRPPHVAPAQARLHVGFSVR